MPEYKHALRANKHVFVSEIEKGSFWPVTLVPNNRKMQRGKNRGRGGKSSEWETGRKEGGEGKARLICCRCPSLLEK